MKIKRSTQILILLALLFGGGVLLAEVSSSDRPETAQPAAEDLFAFTSEDVAAVTLKSEDATLEFQRLEPEIRGGFQVDRWQLNVLERNERLAGFAPAEGGRSPRAALEETKLQATEGEPDSETAEGPEAVETESELATEPPNGESAPEIEGVEESPAEPSPEGDADPLPLNTPVAANEAYVSYLLSFLTNAEIDRAITIPAEQQEAYGLDPGRWQVDLVLDSGETYRLRLGNPDFSDRFLYAVASGREVESAPGEEETVTLLLVSNRLEKALDRPLSEWKEPPFDFDANGQKDSQKSSETGVGEASPLENRPDGE